MGRSLGHVGALTVEAWLGLTSALILADRSSLHRLHLRVFGLGPCFHVSADLAPKAKMMAIRWRVQEQEVDVGINNDSPTPSCKLHKVAEPSEQVHLQTSYSTISNSPRRSRAN